MDLIFIHCFVAFYAYGCPDIFPREFQERDGLIEPEDESEWDRLGRGSSGVPYVLLFLVCWLVIFFNITITAVVKKKIQERSRKINVEEDTGEKLQKSFTAMHPSIKAHGLDSYDILKNRKYRSLILALDSAAAKIQKMSGEQELDRSREDSRDLNSQTDMKVGEREQDYQIESTEGLLRADPEVSKQPEGETKGNPTDF